MEYAGGGTLHKLIVDREGELIPEDTVWEIFVQVSRRSIACKHRRGVNSHQQLSRIPVLYAACGVSQVYPRFKCVAS